MKYFKMHNNNLIPPVGFGTFKIPEGETVIKAVNDALELGYRHIDTAKVYGNEAGVGEAIKNSGIAREEIFLTSKVWNTDQGYDETRRALETSLRKLDTDYLDLYLIHWPKNKNVDTFKAMMKARDEGLIKSIGVSNFKIHHLEELIKGTGEVPVINQVECHAGFLQEELSEYCNERGILIEAWGPLMQGQLFEHESLKQYAKERGTSLARLALRLLIEKGKVVLPKSTKIERMKDNLDIFDFELNDKDKEILAQLNNGKRIGPDPDNIDF